MSSGNISASKMDKSLPAAFINGGYPESQSSLEKDASPVDVQRLRQSRASSASLRGGEGSDTGEEGKREGGEEEEVVEENG